MLLFINIIDELPSLINNNKFSVSTQGDNTIIKKSPIINSQNILSLHQPIIIVIYTNQIWWILHIFLKREIVIIN